MVNRQCYVMSSQEFFNKSKSSRSKVFFKVIVLENYEYIRQNCWCWTVFDKENSTRDVFQGIFWKFSELMFCQTPRGNCYNKLHLIYGGSYHIETSPLICRANQWTDFYMIGTSVMKEFMLIVFNWIWVYSSESLQLY